LIFPVLIFSPISVQSPHVEFDNLEQVKYRLVRDMLPPGKNTDWIWDWSINSLLIINRFDFEPTAVYGFLQNQHRSAALQ
uniref:Piezo_RRas_bdg domain-containing protein n=1 Tax=Heligmosomoides polygyrus TaxID=6339 RepID=A0A183GPH0_HELPZ